MKVHGELAPEPLNGTDAALWDIERDPLLRTTVVSVLLLDQEIEVDRLVGALETAAQLVPRLRQRVKPAVLGLGVPSWVAVDDFDVHDHFRVVKTTPKRGRRPRLAPTDLLAEVLDQVSEFAEQPFDRERPLWESAYIAPLAARRSALVVKMHHSLADGIGGIALLDAILDASRSGGEALAHRSDSVMAPRKVDSEDVGILAPLKKVAGVGERVARMAVVVAVHPTRVAGSVLSTSTSAVRLMAPSGPALSPLFVNRSVRRQAGVHTVEFERFHNAASRHGCTVNHLFLAGVIGGVAAFHHRAGSRVDELRVTMPVSIRTTRSSTAGNQWAPARMRVPAHIDDPIDRMLAMREMTTISQHEPALSLGNQLAGVVHMLPSRLSSRLSSGIVASMMRGVDLTITNVPGLAESRYLAGARVERIYGFAPTGGAAMSVALLSHDGVACFGMLSDRAAISDVDELHKAVADGIDAVVDAAEARAPTVAATGASSEPTADGATTMDRLTALDASFLHLETPSTPMHLGAVFTLDGDELRQPDGRIHTADIRAHVRARLDRAPRLLQRLVEVPLGWGRPLWVSDPDFDIEHHVRFTTVDAPGTPADLAHLCAQLNAERLDRSRPLWEIWIIDGLANGGVALLQKVHHALADGVSTVELASVLFDLEPHPTPVAGPRHSESVPHIPGRLNLLATAWSEQLTEPLDVLRRTVAITADSPGRIVRSVKEVATDVMRLLARDVFARSSPLNRPVGRRREIASTSLAFAEIEEIRLAFEGSANDVALAAIAGGMGAWLASCDEEVTDLRAMCPVSVRLTEVEGNGGNHVGAMMITLPVTEPDPMRRLALVVERTRHAKHHHDGRSVAHVLDAFDHLPDVGGPLLRSIVANQPFANLVITNVPGPRVHLWFAGAQVRSIVPMVPLGSNTTLGIALLSYVDDLTVGFHADPDHVRDLNALARSVESEFSRLRVAAAEGQVRSSDMQEPSTLVT
jgi:diacylglycerol O-acyltransferase / wax synthase